jgi:hypothetical protein
MPGVLAPHLATRDPAQVGIQPHDDSLERRLVPVTPAFEQHGDGDFPLITAHGTTQPGDSVLRRLYPRRSETNRDSAVN